MDDFAKVYLELYNLNKRIYNMEEVHSPEKEGSDMTKIIEFELTRNPITGKVEATMLDYGQISQYEKVVLKVVLIDFPVNNNYAVRLHIATPNHIVSDPTKKEDYQFHNYMIPQSSEPNTFMINFNKIIGNKLNIGEFNHCPLIFEVLDGTGSMLSNQEAIGLYKTNTTQNYGPSDLESIFIKLNELSARQHELEGN